MVEHINNCHIRVPNLSTLELSEYAVQHDGLMLRFILPSLKTPKICEIAVNQNAQALQYVPSELKNQPNK